MHTIPRRAVKKEHSRTPPTNMYPKDATTRSTPFPHRQEKERKLWSKWVALVGVCLVFTIHVFLLLTMAAKAAAPEPLANRQRMAQSTTTRTADYQSAPMERYLIDHADELGYNTHGKELASGCTIWKDPDDHPELHRQLKSFMIDLEDYNRRLENFVDVKKDLRRQFLRLQNEAPDTSSTVIREQVCQQVDLHPQGIPGIFRQSQQISVTSNAGSIEPLFPPMRHPDFCKAPRKALLRLDYLIHDFGTMCRRLRTTSRTIFIDIGASWDFHNQRGDVASRTTSAAAASPNLYIPELYERFGMSFDHIYAYEVTPTDAQRVYQHLPKKLRAAYHWINVGVETGEDDMLNPLSMILDQYDEDDLIVIKLDLDQPKLEWALAQQMLKHPRLQHMVDQLYFEHHVHLEEIYKKWWGRGEVEGSIKDTLSLFHQLRAKGIAAHFWV